MKFALIPLILACICAGVGPRSGHAAVSRAPAHNCEVYGGYLSGDMEAWTEGIAEQERRHRLSQSGEDLYALILSKYGYIGYLIHLKKKSEAADLIDSAEEDLAVLAGDERFAAPAAALKGALIAMRISIQPLRGVYLGRRSLRLIEEALKLDGEDPAGWVEMGNARYHMPSVVGGSRREAARCFSEAVRLFERDGSALRCNWYYLHAQVWLAKSREGLGDLVAAKTIYERLLALEPEFQWVKNELYPDLLKRMASRAKTEDPR